jgi:hypothetical protein
MAGAPLRVTPETPSIEGDLTSVLSHVGPVVKVGGLTGEGSEARRLHVSHEDWQATVKDTAARASLIVLNVGLGLTEGFAWEVQHIVATCAPGRVVCFVAVRRSEYDAFRQWAINLFPQPLPPYRGDGFIGFSHDWRPTFFALPKWRCEGQDAILLALGPVLRSLGLRPSHPDDLSATDLEHLAFSMSEIESEEEAADRQRQRYSRHSWYILAGSALAFAAVWYSACSGWLLHR